MAALDQGHPKEALSALMQGYGDAVYAFCHRMVGPALVDDVHQLTFVHAYESLSSFRRESSLRAWLFGIARHRCLDALRREKRRPVVAADPDHHATAHEPLTDRLANRQLLARCLGTLEAKSREAVVLRCEQGMSYGEMEKICAEKAPALQMRVARALVRLRKCIALGGL